MKNKIKYPLIIFLILFTAGVVVSPKTTGEKEFLRGYIVSILKREFQLEDFFLRIEKGKVSLTIYEETKTNLEKIRNTLSEVEGVGKVKIKYEKHGKKEVLREKETAGFLPEVGLFRPLIADPRFPHFSVGYHHFTHNPEFRDLAATSFGETFLLFKDYAPFHSKWEIGLQAGVFAVFDMNAKSFDLINADYLAAIPIGYRKERFSALFRLLHQSSHLGDEYLLSRNIKRVNLSYESVDFKVSYDLEESFRIYAGSGYMIRREPNELEPLSYQYGLEFKSEKSFLDSRIVPVAGADFKHWEENNWDRDISLRAGFRIENSLESDRIISFLLEYFNGHSPNGQFYKNPIEYIGLGIHFYF